MVASDGRTRLVKIEVGGSNSDRCNLFYRRIKTILSFPLGRWVGVALGVLGFFISLEGNVEWVWWDMGSDLTWPSIRLSSEKNPILGLGFEPCTYRTLGELPKRLATTPGCCMLYTPRFNVLPQEKCKEVRSGDLGGHLKNHLYLSIYLPANCSFSQFLNDAAWRTGASSIYNHILLITEVCQLNFQNHLRQSKKKSPKRKLVQLNSNVF